MQFSNVEYKPDTDTDIVTVQCFFCSDYNILELKHSELMDYMNGTLLQTAFPDLSPSDRELIHSGVCNNCYDLISELTSARL